MISFIQKLVITIQNLLPHIFAAINVKAQCCKINTIPFLTLVTLKVVNAQFLKKNHHFVK